MKLTKLVHSCLIIEKEGQKVLVDPGNYSWQSGIVTPGLLETIDTVVITHGHPDHLYEEFVREVARCSPDALWYGPEEVANTLKDWGISASITRSDNTVRFITSEHADLSPWFSAQPQHTSYVLFDELLIGGDCHTLTENHGARIFAGAINGGPWGGVVGFAKMIEAMTSRPETVIPLHDWHLNDEARQAFYARLPEVLEAFNVQFVPLENGKASDL